MAKQNPDLSDIHAENRDILKDIFNTLFGAEQSPANPIQINGELPPTPFPGLDTAGEKPNSSRGNSVYIASIAGIVLLSVGLVILLIRTRPIVPTSSIATPPLLNTSLPRSNAGPNTYSPASAPAVVAANPSAPLVAHSSPPMSPLSDIAAKHSVAAHSESEQVAQEASVVRQLEARTYLHSATARLKLLSTVNHLEKLSAQAGDQESMRLCQMVRQRLGD